jgi:hypothetical protein
MALSPLYCTNCGAGNHAGAKFCSKCGQTLQIATPSQVGSTIYSLTGLLTLNSLLKQRYRVLSPLGRGVWGLSTRPRIHSSVIDSWL